MLRSIPKLAQPGWSCSNSIKFLDHSSPSAPIRMLREVFLMSRTPPPQLLRNLQFAGPPVGAVYDRAQFSGMHSQKSRAVIDRAYRGPAKPTDVSSLIQG